MECSLQLFMLHEKVAIMERQARACVSVQLSVNGQKHKMTKQKCIVQTTKLQDLVLDLFLAVMCAENA